LFLTGANTQSGHGISGVIKSGIDCAGAVVERNLFGEVSAGAVFSDPARFEDDPVGWDPWRASR
jgi:all-trans-retinol 13,14-reductase